MTFTFSEDVTDFATGDVAVTGGTKGTFAATSAKVYTLVVTPTGSTDVVVTVAADAATDGVNTGPAAAVEATAVWDATAPTVGISDVPSKINSTTAFTATFTFSEDVTDFATGDVAVTGGTKGTFAATSAKVYTLVVTPTGSTDVVVTVAADAATDGVNTGPAAAVEATAVWDAAAPTVGIGGVPSKINSTTAFTATFTFSEDVTDFATGDVAVTGGTKGTFTGTSAKEYTLVVTPTGSVDVVVTVAADAATDGVNTGPAAAVEATAVWDAAAPTVGIGGVPSKINSTSDLTVTFTFSEDVTDFATGDVAVTGGTKGTFTGTSAKEYTLVVTPTGSTDVVVTVAKDAATDGVNAGPAAAVEATAVWDATAPTVGISDVPSKINSTTAFTATFTWAEDVTDFAAGDVAVTGGTKGTFSATSAKVYTLVVTPTGSADVVVTVAKDAATDGVNTGPAAAVEATAVWDATAPTVGIGGVPAKINSTSDLTVTFTWAEDVTDFATGDVAVTGGTKGTFSATSAKVYTLVVTPTGSTDVVVTVAADAATDGVNTGPAAAVEATAVWDATAPTVGISDVPSKINSTTAFTATFTFSEDVTDFAAGDVAVTGGTKGTFAATSAKVYTLVVTPTGSTDVVVTVAADAATDGVNTGPAAAVEATAVWDAAAPTVGIGGVPSKINSTTAFTATFTFSEDVTDFATGDVAVTGGTKGTFTGTSAKEYTLVVTPTGSVDVVVTVAADAATDGVNTGPAAAVEATAVWDAAAPTVGIGGVPSKINSTSDLTVTFTFSEDVTDFATGDVAVTGGTKGTFTGTSAKEYTLVVTPTGSTDVVVTVAKDAATDGVNAGPAAAVEATAVWDATAPTVGISDVPSKINSTTAFTATFTWAEDVTDFAAGDVAVTGGTKGTFSATSAKVYTLVVTPTGSADVVVTVAKDAATDGVNTGPAAAVEATAVWDATAPTVGIGGVPAKINSTSDLTVTFTWAEDVTDFATGDVAVTGGTKGTFSATSAKVYTLVVTPTGSTDVVVTVAADAATDGVNTGPAAAVEATAVWDATAPTVGISDVPSKINSTTAFTATFTFSEDVTDFAAGDVAVTGGTKGTFSATSAKVYTLVVTPTGSTDVVVTVAADAATDGVNTGPAAAVEATAVWDATAPTVGVSDVPSKINSTTAFTATFTFSEDVTDFAAGDVAVTGGSKGTFSATSAKVYTLVVTPTGSADVVVTVAKDAATDGVNTGPAAAVEATAVWDAAAPTVGISGVPSKINSTTAFTATFTFSEDVTDFAAGDVAVTGGTKGTFSATSAREYTLVVTPTGSADVVVTVAKDAATDGVNTGPAAAVEATAVWDATAPTVGISGVPSKINSTTAFTATFTFSEDVTDFATGDVAVTGGTKGTFTATSAKVYTLVVTPTGSTDVVVTVAKDAATDGVNTGPAAAVEATAVWDATAPTVGITGVPAKINSTTAFTATFTFSEDVTDFATGDVAVTGGTKGTFSATSAREYTLVVTPTGSADVVVTVAKDAATDGVNTGPAAAVEATAVWDATAPTVGISDVPSKINSTTAFTATFTFSEDVTDFAAGDVAVTGGTKGTFSATSAKVYTLVVTPTGSVDVVVTVAKDAATDGVNTGPASAETATATWDAAAPTVGIGGVPSKINSTTAFTATFTFSEDVTDFATGDVAVTGGTKGTFSATSAKVYTLVVTPTGSVDVVVTVAKDAATDGVNTGPAAAVEATAVWDATAPTVGIGGVPGRINSTSDLTVTFTWAEDVTDFATGDVAVTGGTKGTFSATSAREYTLAVTPTGSVDVVVTVAKDAATDGVNTGPAAAVEATAVWDAAAPTVGIGGVPGRINSTSDLTVTFTWAEDVTDFAAGDVAVTGGTKGTFTATSAKVYTLVVTPTGSMDVVVTVAKDAATDGVNTGPAAAVTATAVWDAAAPTVGISDVPSKINSTTAFTATFTFSEDVTDFAAGDVAVTGGTKGTFSGTSAKVYTLAVTPTSGSDVVVTVAKDAATDGVNTGPAAAVEATAVWDAAAPTVGIGGVPSKINSTSDLTVTFTFSEDVTDFATGDVAVTGGTKGTFSATSAKVYTLVVTPTGSADVVVTVAKDAATDGVNTGPAAAVEATAVWDATAPTVGIGGVPAKINSTTAFTATFTFSEDVTGFAAGDVAVTGGTKGTFTATSAKVYTLVVTPTGSADVVVTVAKDAATDGVNTGPAAAVEATAVWDAAAPTVGISDVPSKINSTTAFTATFTFSEDVTGFAAGDVAVTGGTKGTFSATSARVYTLVVTPTGSTDVVVTVAKDAATDGVNTGPAAAVEATAVWDAAAPTVGIGDVPSKINSTTAFTATFTFSEDVTDFATGDVAVTGGTKGTFSATSAKVYTLAVTPTGSTDVVVTVAKDAATDGVNTGPAAAVEATATWDAAAPSVGIGGVPSKINSTTAFTATFTFSEDVTDFATGDVAVTGGTKGTFSATSAREYTLVVTPTGSADVVVTVAKDAATDGVNTGPAAAVEATAVWDATAPTVGIGGVPGRINSTSDLTVTFTWAEDVTDFAAGDVAVTGGTKGTFSATSAREYTLAVTPTGSVDVVVTVAADAATDGVNTGPAAAVEATAVWDAAAPSVGIGGVPSKINSTSDLTVTFTWAEDVTDFATGDVAVTGGTKGTFSATSAKVYTLVVTPTGSMDVVVTVAKDAATDGVNTGPAAAVEATAVWDAAAPTVGIGGVPSKINSTTAFTATFTFSEDVTDFATGDVAVTGGTKGTFTATSAKVYTLVVTPTGSVDVVVTVAADSATDGVNTGPASAAEATATWDAAAPSVGIGGVPSKINSTSDLTVTFTFSEDVTDFAAGDVAVTGGTKGTFTATSAKVYTLAVTPTSGSDVVVTVAADSATDGVNTGPAAAVEATAVWDATAPTVGIGGVPAKINSTSDLAVTFTWAEDVTDFATGDVALTGGTKGTFTATSAKVYTLVVTPTGSVDVVVTVAADSATDGLQTGPAAAVTATAVWDSTAPTVGIGGVPSKINSTSDLTVTFTWAEDVTDFATGDVAVTGGTKGTFSATSAREYTLAVTPTGSTDVVVTVAKDAATDGVNTGPAAAVEATATWDAAAPTVGIGDVPSKINSTTAFTATFTWAEDVTDFAAGDVAVTGGTKGTFSATSAKVYTLVVTPTGSMDVVVTVAADAATDGVNTGPAAAVEATAVWDATAPTVGISDVPSKINSTTAFTATFTFSEDVTDFAAGDVAVTGGTKGTFSATSAKVYTLVVTPTGSADVVVTVAKDAATDGVNTGPAAAVEATATWDAAAPTVGIGGVPSKINSTSDLTVTFTFSEDVTDFAAGDVAVTGGTKGTFSATSAKVYTLVVTPTGSVDVVVTVAKDAATDGVNTGPAAAVEATATWDAAAPTVGIGGVPSKINSTTAFTVTFTWAEDVTDFATGDVAVTGGTKGTFTATSAKVYTLVVTPTGSVDVVVTVAKDAATDGVNTGPAAAETATATWDAAAPTVGIGGVPSKINSTTAFTATFTFSEDVTDFATGDVAVTGGTKGTFSATSAKVYTLVVTPTGSVDVVVTVAKDAATDGVNTGPAAAVEATAVWDAAAPTVGIGGVPAKINSTTAFTATFTFSEDVTDFAAGDVAVTGGTKGTFSATSAREYTLVVTPTGSADVVVTVAKDAATDGVNTGPAAAVTATAVWDTTAPTVTGMTVSSAAGTDNAYAIGDTISLKATFDEDVTVTTAGSTPVTGPRIAFDVGGTTKHAVYASGSDSTELVFSYTVAKGDRDADGISVAADALALNGGTIKDGLDNEADLSHSAVAASASHQVDGVLPSVSSASVRGTALTITFDETLGAASSLANSAFTVKKTPQGGTEETVTLSGTPSVSGSAVRLTLAAEVVSTDGDVKVSYAKPTTGTANKVVDAAGNEADGFDEQAVTQAPDYPVTGTADSRELVFFISPDIDGRRCPVPKAFKITTSGRSDLFNNNGTAQEPTNVWCRHNSVQLSFVQAYNIPVDVGQTVTVRYDKSEARFETIGWPLRHLDGTEVASFSNVPLDNVTRAPEISGLGVRGTQLTITYDEPLKEGSGPPGDSFTATVPSGHGPRRAFSATGAGATLGDGASRTIAGTGTAVIAGSTVTVTLEEAVAPDETVTVGYALPDLHRIRDLTDTVARGFSGKAAENDSPAVAPSAEAVAVSSHAGNDDTYGLGEVIRVTLTFSEAVEVTGSPRLKIDLEPADGGEKWAVYESGGGAAALSFAYGVVEPDASTQGVAVLADSLELDGGTIRSAAAQKNADLAHAGLGHDPKHKVDWRPAADTTPPAVESAAVDGETVTVTFDEELSPVAEGKGLRYAFKVSGTAVDQHPARASATGRTVTMRIGTVAVAGQSITVSYASTGQLRDSAGNEVATFSGQAVRNDTPRTATVSVEAGPAPEGAAVRFKAKLSAAVSSDVVLGWTTGDDDTTGARQATAGTDYTAVTNGSVTIAASATEASFTVSTTADTDIEGDETFKVTITGPTLPAGVTIATATAIGTIEDDNPPTASDVSKTVDEDTTLTFAAADFAGAFSDPDGHTLKSVKIVTLPDAAHGTMKVGTANATAGQSVAAADLGTIRFEPAANWSGTASFTYQVTDSSDRESAAAATVTITVEAEASAPAFDAGSAVTLTIAENHADGAEVGTVAASDADGDALTYWLSGADAVHFEISGAGTITVRSGRTLDHEARASYAVTAAVSDGKDAAGNAEQEPTADATIAVTISVTNVEEPPGAPTGVTVSGASATTLVVSWTAPEDSGAAAIAGYELRYHAGETDPGETAWTHAGAVGRQTSTTLAELAADTGYRVQVRARGDGAGPWSASGAGRTGTARAPAFDAGDEVTLTIAENHADGAEVGTVAASDADGDTLTYWLSGADAVHFEISAAGTITVRSGKTLDHEAQSSYAVTAAVSDGEDAAGNAERTPTADATIAVTISVTNVEEPPGAPTDVTVSAATATTLVVSWTAPADAGAAAIAGYDVRYHAGESDPGTEAGWTQAGAVGTETNATIAELAADTGYRVQVRARGDGAGPWSASGAGRTWTGAPAVEAVAVVSDAGADATYAPGDTIRVRVSFSEAVTVDTAGGRPRLRIDMDPAAWGEKWAAYESGGGTANLTFAYAVVAPNTSTRGIAVPADTLELNGGRIRSAVTGTAAALAHEGLDHDPAHQVDTTGPAFAGTTVSGTALTITFDEPLDPASAPPADAFTATVDTRGTPWHRVIRGTGDVQVEGAEVRVTLATAVFHGRPVTVAYVPWPEDGGRVRDVAGNEAGVFFERQAVNATPAPAVSGTVNGRRLVLTFGSALMQGAGPAGSAFTVTAARPDGPLVRTIAGTGRTQVAGTTATVTLADEVWPGDTVTVSYARPRGGPPLSYAPGSEVAEFSGEPVANETPEPAPEVRSVKVVSDAGEDEVYTEGETIEAVVLFTSAVRVEREEGVPTLALIMNGTIRRASHAPDVVRPGLVFRYAVSEADGAVSAVRVAASGLKLDGGAIVAATEDGTPALLGFGAAPGVTGVAIADEPDGHWEAGDTVAVTLRFAEPVTVVEGAPSVALSLGGGERRAVYARGSGSEALVFGYALVETDGEQRRVAVVEDGLSLGDGSIVSIGGGLAVALAHAAAERVLTPPPVLPALSVADARGPEGGTIAFAVRLSAASERAVTVDWASADGTAVAGEDYRAAAGTLSFAPGERERTVEVAALADEAVEGEETFTLALSNASGATIADGEATGTVTDVAPGTGPALTAAFIDIPAEHDGTRLFSFELRFSEDFPGRLSYKLLRDEAFQVTNGRVRIAGRVAQGQNQRWEISVRPDSLEDVIVTLPAATDCALPGAVCTEAGRKLANTVTALVPGPALLSVADARAREGVDAAMEFEVTLSRAASGVVTVDYDTGGGTATAGEDYTATSGTLTFAAGEVAKTVAVPVLDDGHDEGEETFRFRLSNAHGAVIADRVATGTIENEDAMPRAWLARFGRTLAEQVVEGVQARLEAPRGGGAQVRLAGQELGAAGGIDAEEAVRRADEALVRWLEGAPEEMRTMTGGELLTGSGFALASAPEEGSSVALWGRGSLSRFDGREGSLSVDGALTSAELGADYASGAWLAGVMAAHVRGDGSYGGDAGAGAVASALTGVFPYAGVDLSERLSAWAVAGLGLGGLTLTPEGARALETDLTLALAALGARGLLVEPAAGSGFTLAIETDAYWVRTNAAAAPGLAEAQADATRIRLGLDGGYRLALGGGGTLEPTLEVGVRHDGGHAESGYGMDLGGGLAWSDPALGLSAELAARGLLAHRFDGFRDLGLSGSLAWDPDPSSDRGPSLSVTQTLGASATGGMHALLGQATLASLPATDDPLRSRRLDILAGYGLAAADDRFTATPEVGLTLEPQRREYRLGWRLAVAADGPASFEITLEGARSEHANHAAAPEHTFGIHVTARW